MDYLPRSGVERAWHLSKGQTMENTKISDRTCALICSTKAWGEINNHLQRKQRIQDAVDEEEAYKNYLKTGSLNMTKNWDNSVENMRKKRIALVEERKATVERQNAKRLEEMFAENEVERNEYLTKMQNLMFTENKEPKMLHSPLAMIEALYERDAQIAFNKILKKEREDDERIINAQMVEDDRRGKEEEMSKENNRREIEKKLQSELMEQIKKKHALNLENDEIEKQTVLQDVANMERELREINIENNHKDRRAKHQVRVKLLEAIREHEEYLNKIKKVEEEEDKLIEVYLNAKCSLTQKIKKQDADGRRKKEERNAKMGMDYFSDSSTVAENARLQKAIDEKEEKDLKHLEERAAYDKKLREDLLQSRKEYLASEEKRLAEDEQQKKWDLLNRLKNNEIYKKFLEENKIKNTDKCKEIKSYLCAQMAENRNNLKREKDQELKDCLQVNKCLEESDKRFMEYAEDLIANAKKRGRNTYPLDKVYEQFKIRTGYSKPKKCSTVEKTEETQQNTTPQRKCYNYNKDPTFGRCKCTENRLYM